MKAAPVRPVIGWCLLIVVLVSAWAWLVPVRPADTVRAVERLDAPAFRTPDARGASEGLAGAHESPRLLSRTGGPTVRHEYEPALRDPFAAPPARTEGLPRAAVAPPLMQTLPPASMPMPQPVLIQPSVPRYLGQLRTPQGDHLVLLDDGGTTVSAQAGTRLPSGWEVAALEPGRVRLVMAGTSASASVEVPSGSEPAR